MSGFFQCSTETQLTLCDDIATEEKDVATKNAAVQSTKEDIEYEKEANGLDERHDG